MSIKKMPSSKKDKRERESKISRRPTRKNFLFILNETNTKVFIVASESLIYPNKVELNLLNKQHFSETCLHKLGFSHKNILHKNCTFHFIKAHLYLIKQTIEIESLRKMIKLEPGEHLYEIDYDEHRKSKGRNNVFYQSLDLDRIKADFQKSTLMHKFLIYGIDAYKKY